MQNSCLLCGKETSNPKFCSKSCSAKSNNRTPKRKLSRTCSKCSNLIRNWRSTLCEEHFQNEQMNKSDFIKNLTIADYSNRDSVKHLHKSSQFAHIRGLNRTWNKELTKLPCKICGYSKHVELAHIKAISSFPETAKLSEVNSKDNVVQLCPNCHWEFDNNLLELPN